MQAELTIEILPDLLTIDGHAVNFLADLVNFVQ